MQTECDLSGEPVIAGALKGLEKKKMSVVEYHKLTYNCRLSSSRLLKAWNATESQTGTGRPIDAIVTPPAASPSFVPGEKEYLMYTVSLLRMAVTSGADLRACATCTIFPPRCCQSSPWTPRSTSKSSLTTSCRLPTKTYTTDVSTCLPTPLPKALSDRPDDPERYHGMPIGVQVIGQRGEDEAVLRMAEIVDAAFKAAQA